MGNLASTTPGTSNTNQFLRSAERRARQQRLIFALRRVAYLASWEAYELETRAERSRVARLVGAS